MKSTPMTLQNKPDNKRRELRIHLGMIFHINKISINVVRVFVKRWMVLIMGRGGYDVMEGG